MARKTSEGQGAVRSARYDGQSLAALVGGILLILISFFTNYGYDDLPGFFSLQANE